MPVVYSDANVVSTNIAVRAANEYQAYLDFAANRLSGADFTILQAAITAAGLPTDSSDVLTLPQAIQAGAALRTIVLAFVGVRPINVVPLAALPQAVAALTVGGNITGGGTLNITGLLQALSGATINGPITVTGNGTISGSVTAGGQLDADSLQIGTPPTAPGAGDASVEGQVLCADLSIDNTTAPGAAPNGTLAEDATGDMYYKTQAGTAKYLTRPQHDTGWLSCSGGVAGMHPAIGIAGTGGSARNPTPGLTPDIYAGTPLVLAGVAPFEPGSDDGPSRIATWLRVEKSLIDGGAVGADFYYFQAQTYDIAGFLGGAHAFFDSVTGEMSIDVGEATLIQGRAAAGTGVNFNAPLGSVDVRAMVWIR